MNVIFGSGIVGLMAKHILPGDWTFVPFGRSRFYSFNPALGDNFISRDDEIDHVVKEMTGDHNMFLYRRFYSFAGSLIKQHDDAVASGWLSKVFGNDVPDHALAYMSKRSTSSIYGTRVNSLYAKMLERHGRDLLAERQKGDVSEIGDHYFIRSGVRHDFDKAVSTIPLPTLMSLMGKECSLKSLDEHFILAKARIDLEGCNQALVADALIDFYKVMVVAPDVYLFCSTREIPMPGQYLMSMIGNVDIIEGTRLVGSIPAGNRANIKWLDDYGIFCVGSHAEWDWCADVGSNVLKLIRYANRGHKPNEGSRSYPGKA